MRDISDHLGAVENRSRQCADVARAWWWTRHSEGRLGLAMGRNGGTRGFYIGA
jgi:hypothetical protein